MLELALRVEIGPLVLGLLFGKRGIRSGVVVAADSIPPP
jgi:hypothetical protein